MKLDKFLALSAYAVQAVASLGLVFAVSHLLNGGEYGHYSLIVATAQTVAVIGFEWVRLAASRFCATKEGTDIHILKDTIQAAFAGAACLVLCVAVFAAFFGLASWLEIAVGLGIVLLIGVTDLLLVFLRVQGSFNQFAVLQMVRAFALFACSVAGAYFGRSAHAGLVGLCAGYSVTLVAYVLAAPRWWRWKAEHVRQALFKDMAVYGVSVAAASNIHLQVPLLIRWLGKAFLPVEGFAGLSLAMDVLQKPFALVTSAVGGILSPGVIVEFDGSNDPSAPKLRQLYEVQLWAVFLMLGLAIGLLPDLCHVAVKPELRDWVTSLGVPVALIFAGHTLIQTTISIPGHLLHMGRRLIGHAAIELAFVAGLMIWVLYFDLLRPTLWLWLGTLGVLLSILTALPLVMKVPCQRPVAAIYLGGAVAFLVSLLYFVGVSGNVLLMIVKATVALCISGLGLWLYRRIAR